MKPEKQNQNQTGGTEDNDNIPTRTRPASRRIDAATIAEMAELCSKQLTESESCRLLGLKPRHWFSWKSRHKRAEKFASLLEEFRAGRIKDLIARVEKCADGVGMKQPDWRAAAFLLSVADAKRFSTSGGVSVEVTAIQSQTVMACGSMDNLLKLIAAARQALPAPAGSKQITLAAEENINHE